MRLADALLSLAAVTRRPVTHEARERHLAAIEAAIRDGAPAPVPRRDSRRVATLMLVAVLAVLPSGTYLAEPQPDDRYLGTAPAQEFIVGDTDVLLDIRYDPGIR